MWTNAIWRPIVDDEGLVHGLPDPEASLLIDWLVERCTSVERTAAAPAVIAGLRRRGRVISRFVRLWCLCGTPGAASQLAASEGMRWPLPPPDTDSYTMMHDILEWESANPG